jgi:hypothetical protein
MPDVYAYKRARVAALLRRWNSGTVTLTRITTAAPEEETPWIPGEATSESYTLDARVDGVAADYVDGVTVIESDLVVIMSPKARLDGVVVDLEPRMSDVITIDDAVKRIKKIQPVPAAGPAAMFQVFVAS